MGSFSLFKRNSFLGSLLVIGSGKQSTQGHQIGALFFARAFFPPFQNNDSQTDARIHHRRSLMARAYHITALMLLEQQKATIKIL